MVGMLSEWVGREETQTDIFTAGHAERFSATLSGVGSDAPVGVRNPLLAWTLCTSAAAHSTLGPDGHPQRGGFLPPVEMPRRMWAGSVLTFSAPFEVGMPITRRSRIAAITEKKGSSGALVFVTVEHEIYGEYPLMHERQDIVYRDNAGVSSNPPMPVASAPGWSPEWCDSVQPSSVLLQRYSAITFNAHRIHYDRDYATHVEGYPALVVHGPLIATLLLDQFLAKKPNARVKGFEFRAKAPLFDDAPFQRTGIATATGAELRAIGPDGTIAMTARVLT